MGRHRDRQPAQRHCSGSGPAPGRHRRTLPQLEAMIVTDPKVESFLSIDRAHARPLQRSGSRAPCTRAYTASHRAKDRARLSPARGVSQRRVSRHDPQHHRSVRSADGNAWYEYLVRTQTTTDLTPDQIFQLGQRRDRAHQKRDGAVARTAAASPAAWRSFPVICRQQRRAPTPAAAILFRDTKRFGTRWRRNSAKLFGRITESAV